MNHDELNRLMRVAYSASRWEARRLGFDDDDILYDDLEPDAYASIETVVRVIARELQPSIELPERIGHAVGRGPIKDRTP